MATVEMAAALDPVDLNHVLIEDMWGEESLHWLFEQLSHDATPAAERACRQRLAGLTSAPVIALHPASTTQTSQRRAA